MIFEKLSGYQVFKKHNRNPFRSYSSLSIRFPFVFAVFFIPSYRLLSSYFRVSPSWWLLPLSDE